MMMTLAQSATEAGATDGTYFLWGCILFAIAVVILVIELFVPSGGLLGILCGLAAIGSIVAFFQYSFAWGMGAALAYVLLTPILLVFVFKLWLHSPIGKAMILGGGDPSAEEPEDAVRRSEDDRLKRLAALRELIGAEGVTETALRPVGTVRINGVRTDGLSEAGIIEANTPVVVTDVYDNQIKVRPRASAAES